MQESFQIADFDAQGAACRASNDLGAAQEAAQVVALEAAQEAALVAAQEADQDSAHPS